MVATPYKTTEPEWRALGRLALPLIAFNIGTQAMAAVDTALAGRINALAQAATGLGGVLLFAGALLGMGIAMGIDPMTSQAIGARRDDLARHALWQSVWVCSIIAGPIMAVLYAAGRMLELVGISPELAAETRRFLDPRILSCFPLFLLTAARSYLQSAHRTGAILFSTVVANLFNLALAWVLVFGDGALAALGLPPLGVRAMGVAGLGWATTLATTLNLAIFTIAIARMPGSGKGPALAPDRATIARIFALGLPIGLHMLAEVGIFSVAGFLAARMGEIEMAAHQVALQLAALMFMVPLGVSSATSVRVGRAIGARDEPLVRAAGFAGIALGASFMSMSAISMWTLAPFYAHLMTTDAAVVPLAAQLITIGGAFQLFDGIQVVSAGALRGAGLTRWTMRANLVSYWLIAFPLVLALGLGLKLGTRGIWWGLTAGLACAAVLLSSKFASVSRVPLVRLDNAA